MLATECPNCGAPSRVSLVQPDRMSCRHCGYGGAPPPDVQAHLSAAARALHHIDVRRRQLTALQRRTLLSAGLGKALFLVVLVLLTLPFGTCAMTCTRMSDSVQTWAVVLLGFGPLAIVLAAGALGVWLIGRRRRQLEDACVAAPPLAPGEPAGCRVCGADLVVGADRGIVRCPYCQADNIVSPEAMARRASSSATATGVFEQQVRQQAASLHLVTGTATFIVLLAALAAPFVVVVVALVVGSVLMKVEGPADETVDYAFADTESGRCVGELVRASGGGLVIRLGKLPQGGGDPAHRAADPASLPRVRASGLVGLHVHGSGGRPGTVKRVFELGSDEGVNQVEVAYPDGTSSKQAAIGTCLVGDSPPVELARWTERKRYLARDIALDKTHVYVADSDLILRVPKGGGAVQTLSPRIGELFRVLVDDERVYAVSGSSLVSMSKTGGAKRVLSAEVLYPTAVAMDATHLFFGRAGKLVRVPKAGGAAEVLGGEAPVALRLDERRVYMVPSLGDCRIYSVPKTGGEAVAVDRCSSSFDMAMAVDDAWVYWVGGDRSLRRAPKTGGPSETVAGVRVTRELVVRAGTLLWFEPGAIWLRAAGSTSRRNLAPGASQVRIALDGGHAYWVDVEGNRLLRRSL